MIKNNIYKKIMGALTQWSLSALKPALQIKYRPMFFITLVILNIFLLDSCASSKKKEIIKEITFNINGIPNVLNTGDVYFVNIKPELEAKKIAVFYNDKRLTLISTKDASFNYLLAIPLETESTLNELIISAEFDNNYKIQKVVELNIENKDRGEEKLWVDPSKVVLSKVDKRRVEKESKEIRFIVEEINSNRYWNDFICPVEICIETSNFGIKRTFNNLPRGYHSGVDLKANFNTPIYAPSNGKVVLAKDLFYCGNAVIIDHGLGVYSLMCHFSRILVNEGREIQKGTVLGLAGSTGRSTGPHLHWTLYVDNVKIDPMDFLGKVNQYNF